MDFHALLLFAETKDPPADALNILDFFTAPLRYLMIKVTVYWMHKNFLPIDSNAVYPIQTNR